MLDMNKTFMLPKEKVSRSWHLVDANGKCLGRLATQIARLLRGKDKPTFTPHTDNGDYVVVINCSKVVLSSNKLEQKEYKRYSGWRSGLKVRTASEYLKKDPTFLVRHAVKGMLPRNKMARQLFRRLKLYAGSEHKHAAQLGAS